MRFVLALVCALAAAGCSDEDELPFSPDEQEELEEAEARWAARPFEDYVYQIRQACFCQNSGVWATVTVTGGVVTAVQLDNGTPVPAEDFDQYPTVELLFERISLYAEGDGVTDVAASYHADLGYPSHISVSSTLEDAGYTADAQNLLPQP
jgi:hypothetical protein